MGTYRRVDREFLRSAVVEPGPPPLRPVSNGIGGNVALKKLAFNAAALSAARAIQTAATFLALPLLARLLAPEQFGLVALAMSFVLFTMAFSDAGMGQSLVRTPPE